MREYDKNEGIRGWRTGNNIDSGSNFPQIYYFTLSLSPYLSPLSFLSTIGKRGKAESFFIFSHHFPEDEGTEIIRNYFKNHIFVLVHPRRVFRIPDFPAISCIGEHTEIDHPRIKSFRGQILSP